MSFQTHHTKKHPLISVIIPCYNSAKFVVHTVKSVLSQTFADFELLIIDDGSTDETGQVISTFLSDARVRTIFHEKNKGLPAARNTGIRNAKGSLIAFLDSDDTWLPQKLETQVEAFDDPQVGVCCVEAYIEHRDSTIIFEQTAFPSEDDLYSALLFRNVIPGSASSVVVRKQCFEEVGVFDESLIASEDRDMWIRLSARYKFAFIDSPLVTINRSQEHHMSDNFERMARGYEGFIRNREKDIPERFRYLLPRARRYAHLRTATRYFKIGDPKNSYRYARLALAESLYPDKQLRRAIRIVIWFYISQIGSRLNIPSKRT